MRGTCGAKVESILAAKESSTTPAISLLLLRDQIEDAVSSLLAQGLHPLALGGDHSITFPIVSAIAREYSSLSILHFDAHPDIYHDFRGNPFSHASPFARIMEAKLAQRLVQVGIRTMNAHQREQADRFGVEVIEMKDFERWSEARFPNACLCLSRHGCARSSICSGRGASRTGRPVDPTTH